MATKKIVKRIPNTASKTVGSSRLPSETNVDAFATTIPAFLSPIKAIKKPIPAPIACLSCFGIALMIFFLIPVTETIRKNRG